MLAMVVIIAILLALLVPKAVETCEYRHKNLKIAVLVYNIGGYDSIKFARRQEKVPCDIDAFFYTTRDSVPKRDLKLLRAQGWRIIFTTRVNATVNNSSDRLTSKRLKWNLSSDFKEYNYVLTHDCNLYIDYAKVRDFIASEMSGYSVLFQNWQFSQYKSDGYRIFWEINDFLTTRVHRIRESEEETKKWRDMLLNDDTYNPEPYFQTNVFIFNPRCVKYQTFGRKVYSHCHKLQRDQFIVPYVLFQENVPFKVKSQQELVEKIGYKIMGNHLISENEQRSLKSIH